MGLEGMTVGSLVEALKEFIRDKLKDCRSPVKQAGWGDRQEERVVEVSDMVLPDPDEAHERVPYILLEVLNGKDERGRDGQMHSRVNVRMVITLYDRDKREGRLRVVDIIQRLREALIRAGTIGGSFELLWPLEWLVYPDDTQWVHMGEMSTEWSIPCPEREIPELEW